MPMDRRSKLILCGGTSMILSLGACATLAQNTAPSPAEVVVTRSSQPRAVTRVITTNTPPGAESREIRIKRKSADGDETVELWINGKKIDVNTMDDVKRALGEEGENIDLQIVGGPGSAQTHGMMLRMEPPEGNEADEDGEVPQFQFGDGMEIDLSEFGLRSGFGPAGPITFTRPKAMLGVGLASISDDLRDYLGLADDAGVRINSVVDDSPAAKAGLQEKDIIIAAKIGSESHGSISAAELRKVIADAEPGTEVTLTILRKGDKQQITAMLAKWDAQSMGLTPPFDGQMHLATPQLFNPGGLQIEVFPQHQLRRGMLEIRPQIRATMPEREHLIELQPDRDEMLKMMEQQMEQMQKVLDQLRQQQEQIRQRTESPNTPEA